MIYKITLKIVAVLIYFYMCGMLFNHVNAWLGIGGVLIGGVFIIDRVIKKIKKNL